MSRSRGALVSSKLAAWKQAEKDREEELRQQDEEYRRRLAAPGEGYGSIGPLLPGELRLCMRCSAVVFGEDRHDAWHASL